jgi:hypothetical protein
MTPSGAEEAVEKGAILYERPEKRTSGAKALVDSSGVVVGVKTPTYRDPTYQVKTPTYQPRATEKAKRP